MIDILHSIERGYRRRDEELPALSLYGWAMQHLDHDPDDWDETRIHLSDYRYYLDPEDGGCERQLWHRLREDQRDDPTLWMRLMWDQGFAMQVRVSWLIDQGLPTRWTVLDIEADLSGYLPNGDVGSCDLVLGGYDREDPNEMPDIMGVEFKTQRGRAFRYLDEPKPSHTLQSEAEAYALQRMHPKKDVEHRLVYLDREGQNEPLVFPTRMTPESFLRIEAASDYVHSIADDLSREGMPPILEPEINVRENKGPNSIYLEQPWVCDYCDFAGQSCPGALRPELTDLGIVAKGDHEDVDALSWKVGQGLEQEVAHEIERAVNAGNVSYK